VQAAEPPALAAGLLEPLANAAVDARVSSPISPPKRTLDAATAIDALDQALQQGELDPASWSTLVAAHAADLDAGDLAQLAACATDTERALSARLAALELLRASASREAAILDAEFEARLEGAAFGPDTQGITSFAAAATLAAFGGAQSRAGMLERLEAGADWRPTSVCLHGLREGADAAVLEQISARLQRCASGEPQRRLAAAAQGMAPRLAREAHGEWLATGALALLDAACIPELDALARRRLLHSAAALGEAHSQRALCELALDPRIDPNLALEACAALRASPSFELMAVLEARLDDTRIDPERRRVLEAICDERRGEELAR
jgi:hypothetical protein